MVHKVFKAQMDFKVFKAQVFRVSKVSKAI
jgi:hypothetical protein